MNDAVWILGALAMAGYGAFVFRFDVPARFAIALAAGTVIGGVVMFFLSIAGVGWSRVTLGIPLLVGLCSFRRVERRPGPAAATLLPAVPVALVFYALASARITNVDYMLFWGAKGVHFHRAAEIDVAFLKAPHHFLMHSDYPPLLPLVYSFASTSAAGFSWWGGLILSGIYFAATVAVFAGFTRSALFAAFMAAVLGVAYVSAGIGGIAEPLLIFLLVTAVCPLTFGPDVSSLNLISAICLAGAALTKVEGAGLVAIVIASAVFTRRAIVLAVIPAVALGAWLVFVRYHGLVDGYARAREPMHFELLGSLIRRTIREASFGAFYLPWVAAAAALLAGRNWKRAQIPLLAAIGSIAAIIFYYLHTTHVERISESAHRLLLAPLAFLTIAAAAAADRSAPLD